jgi:hypothetical protein
MYNVSVKNNMHRRFELLRTGESVVELFLLLQWSHHVSITVAKKHFENNF